jgi:hypothetical protein
VIESYEVPILRTFSEAGLRVGWAVDGPPQGNPTLHPWWLLLDQGAPFVKVELLRDNPVKADLGGWIDQVSRRGYPVRLILNHLQRTAAAKAAGLRWR